MEPLERQNLYILYSDPFDTQENLKTDGERQQGKENDRHKWKGRVISERIKVSDNRECVTVREVSIAGWLIQMTE